MIKNHIAHAYKEIDFGDQYIRGKLDEFDKISTKNISTEGDHTISYKVWAERFRDKQNPDDEPKFDFTLQTVSIHQQLIMKIRVLENSKKE